MSKVPTVKIKGKVYIILPLYFLDKVLTDIYNRYLVKDNEEIKKFSTLSRYITTFSFNNGYFQNSKVLITPDLYKYLKQVHSVGLQKLMF